MAIQKKKMLNQEISKHFGIGRSTLLGWLAKYKNKVAVQDVNLIEKL